jgi:hypothetical protein
MSVGQVEGVDPMTLIIWKQAMMLDQCYIVNVA